MLDLRQVRLIDGVPFRQFRDMSAYKQAFGLAGRTVEFVGELPNNPDHRILFFTDGTYFECETWLS